MRSLYLLVLLLFAVVMCTAISPTEMKELLANGAPQRLRSFNELYLTDDRPAIHGLNIWTMPKQDWLQDWTIERINDNEVVIKSNRVAGNFFIADNMEDEKYNYAKEARVANDQQPSAIFTPVKNPNGSWSFKSRANKWLSAHAYYKYYDPKRYYVNFQPDNMNCEHWFLEPYTPPSPSTIMDELLANGGKRQFKSYNELYLTYDSPSSSIWTFAKDVIMNTKQDWTIVQMNNNEVAIKSNDHGFFIGHGGGGWAKAAVVPDEWEMLTPVKNDDGTWSFHSRWNGWLSAHTLYERDRYYVNFQPDNKACERWVLEPYTTPTPTLMDEYLTNGGNRTFKSYESSGGYHPTSDLPRLWIQGVMQFVHLRSGIVVACAVLLCAGASLLFVHIYCKYKQKRLRRLPENDIEREQRISRPSSSPRHPAGGDEEPAQAPAKDEVPPAKLGVMERLRRAREEAKPTHVHVRIEETLFDGREKVTVIGHDDNRSLYVVAYAEGIRLVPYGRLRSAPRGDESIDSSLLGDLTTRATPSVHDNSEDQWDISIPFVPPHHSTMRDFDTTTATASTMQIDDSMGSNDRIDQGEYSIDADGASWARTPTTSTSENSVMLITALARTPPQIPVPALPVPLLAQPVQAGQPQARVLPAATQKSRECSVCHKIQYEWARVECAGTGVAHSMHVRCVADRMLMRSAPLIQPGAVQYRCVHRARTSRDVAHCANNIDGDELRKASLTHSPSLYANL